MGDFTRNSNLVHFLTLYDTYQAARALEFYEKSTNSHGTPALQKVWQGAEQHAVPPGSRANDTHYALPNNCNRWALFLAKLILPSAIIIFIYNMTINGTIERERESLTQANIETENN
jgi:hypothetical protein